MRKIIWTSLILCFVGTFAGGALAQDATGKGQVGSKDTETKKDAPRQRGPAPQKCVQRCDAEGKNCWTDCDPGSP